MADERVADADDMTRGDAPAHRRLSLVLIALSCGIAVGAVVLSLYAFVRRVPDGLISDRLGPISTLLGGSLAAVIIAAVLVMAGGVLALAGRVTAGRAAWAPTALSAVTAYAFLGSMPADRAKSITGPGAYPVIAWSQMSWALLTVAAVLLVAGAVTVQQTSHPAQRKTALAVSAVGLVASLVVGFGIVAVANGDHSRGTTAAPIAVPELPTALRTNVAYSVVARYSDWVVAAGPGFVATDDSAFVAYDGTTGAERWRFPFSAFPTGCTAVGLRSTGWTPDSVVLLECRHTYYPPYSAGSAPFLVGLDAMTGQVLWTADEGWHLAGRVQLSADAFPVRRGDDIASLDPRTGSLRWSRTLTADEQCEGYGDGVTGVQHSIVVIAACNDVGALHVIDGRTGQQHSVNLSGPPGTLPPNDTQYDLVAASGNNVVIESSKHTGVGRVTLLVDTGTGDVHIVPSTGYLADVSSARSGQYPGSAMALGKMLDPDKPARLLLVGEGKTITTVGVRTYDDQIFASQKWAQVGAQLVTAAGLSDNASWVWSVSPDGQTTRHPSPCGDDVGGIMTVPGAVLVLCRRTTGEKVSGYDILGLR
ncbi:hypothetical protein A5784_13725 [Mycobacterium sp. 852013-50091_SCH5140682]|uniref:outer membrane protein assembly factor BamB family protein n=1 Tax=Mycobacterium sp. 852013-50091_SCH5140682 TaxID=1834109 RepID=UPI0007EA5357|nr:PQQ-binding-like beta-propeller repeat protein [Mycobacterium sp. 852013-50091_SCH5140682]OBC04606.1 hypothetical protein A5784_13725 [Mycobacterium sp. 852013-50091_SCH5140682]